MPDVDMPQMEKAKKVTHMRQTTASPGKSGIPKFSIINISDDEIGLRVARLGISLGSSEMEMEKSIKGIKLLEENRILTLLQKKSHDKLSEEEGLSSFVMSKVSTLCEDLVEEDDILLGIDDDIEPTNIRRSSRKRIKKQYS
jgi:flagellar basal body-associated protein FliL